MTYPPNIVQSSDDLNRTNGKSPLFYVQVEGVNYGPYTSDLMQGYVIEQRIGPQSLLSDQPNDGYKHAIYWPEFQHWQRVADKDKHVEKPAALPSVFIVVADLHSGNSLAFLKSLQSLGQSQRLSESVWILAAEMAIEDIRNSLSESLTHEDRLFIHDSFSNRAGWFNIGETLDQNITSLWMDTAQKRKTLKGQ